MKPHRTIILAIFFLILSIASAAPHRELESKFAVGTNFGCLVSLGNAYCWGINDAGQLGLGDQETRFVPTRLPSPPGERIQAIFAGEQSACSLLENGKVKCWGNNSFGVLGYEDSVPRGGTSATRYDRLGFVNLGSNQTVSTMAIGREHSCAILTGGRLKCWGHNTVGELGIGSTEDQGGKPNTMGDELPFVNLGPNAFVEEVCVGGYHTCARLKGGLLKCWGVGTHLGLHAQAQAIGFQPSQMGSALKPINLGTSARVRSVTCGNDSTCVLLEGGSIKCFGRNHDGILGNEKSEPSFVPQLEGEMGEALLPVNLGEGLFAEKIACRGFHCCAVTMNQALKCWGWNYQGQLGLEHTFNWGGAPNMMGDHLPFIDVGKLAEVRDVSLGQVSSCVLLADKKIKCWGPGRSGGLGSGFRTDHGATPHTMGEFLPSLVFPGIRRGGNSVQDLDVVASVFSKNSL